MANCVILRTCLLWNLLTGHTPTATATPPSSVSLSLTMIWWRMSQPWLPKCQMNHRTGDTDGASWWPLSFAILCLSIAVFAMGCSSRNSLNTLEDRRQICHWLPPQMPLCAVSAVSIHSVYRFLWSLGFFHYILCLWFSAMYPYRFNLYTLYLSVRNSAFASVNSFVTDMSI